MTGHAAPVSFALLLGAGAWLLVAFRIGDLPQRRWVGGLLAHVWTFNIRMLAQAGAVAAGLWSFAGSGPQLYGVPIDGVMALALTLGFWVNVVAPRWPWPLLLAVDVILSLLCLPFATLNAGMLAPLLAISALSVLPARLLARWTADDRAVYGRSLLQAGAWTLALFWLLPSILMTATGQSWDVLTARPLAQILALMVAMLPAAVLVANAMYIFARDGDGTAFPYDPPKRLVTAGVYAYVSNPMQIGICVSLAIWGLALGSLAVTATGAAALALFIVFRDVCNGSCQVGRSDPEWAGYQRQVRRWWPRWAPEGGLHKYRRVQTMAGQPAVGVAEPGEART